MTTLTVARDIRNKELDMRLIIPYILK